MKRHLILACLITVTLGLVGSSLAAPNATPRKGVFSKVGDSITASPLFLAPIGNGGFVAGEHPQLQAVVDHFIQTAEFNSFTHQSTAATPGWTSVDLLNPDARNGAPNSAGCEPGETPLACEYRMVQPSVALIMIGTNDILRGVDIDTYTANLQEILRITKAAGVLPIVSTIPDIRVGNADFEGKVYEFNAVIFRMARANGALIWDYWAAMQNLPNLGLSGDGVHPSEPPNGESGVMTGDQLQFGYTLRNLTALQMLQIAYRRGY